MLLTLQHQVSALLAIPWLEHWEFHHVIAGLAATLVKLPQRGIAVAGGVYKVGYWQQLQQLMLNWKAQEMKRCGTCVPQAHQHGSAGLST